MAQSVAVKGFTSNLAGKGISKVTWQKLRGNAVNRTEFYDISQQSKLLPELRTGSIVYPKLEAVEFYKGGDMSDDCYIPQSAWMFSTKQNEWPGLDEDYYVPQSTNFFCKQKHERESGYPKVVTLKDILEDFKEGQISFVGPAGSGKTTLVKAITRQIIEGKYKNLSSIEVVHFVHLRAIKRNDLITPAELLFRNVTPEMSGAEMEEAMQYVKENPDKVLFVIDSLDTIGYTIDGVYTGITTDDRSSPEVILFHLLSGNLLPGCRFITSSREYAIRNYKGDVQAKEIIALAGLAKESMRKIVVGYVGEEDAEDKMAFLERKPIIESLCATPVWLIFTLMALSIQSKFTPTTMASILVILLQNLIRSEHVHEWNIEVILGKLGKMAFTGTKEYRVEFSLYELQNFNLVQSEIRDLMVATPSGAYQKLILGDSTLKYAHQCIQEILSAFHIVKMDLKEFKEFISMYIHKPHFALVRSLLAGILLNYEVFQEAESFLDDASDFERKKLYLRRSLDKQLKLNLSQEDRLELYMCLSETGHGANCIIQNKIDKFDIFTISLSPSDMYCIGWVISQQKFIKRLKFFKTDLTQASLSALYHALEGSNVQLRELYICYNKGLGPDEMKFIAKILVQCATKILNITECEPKAIALQAFLDSSVGAKLDELDVPSNTFGPDEMRVIAEICKQRNVDRFHVGGCRFLSGALKSFLLHSTGAKIHELEISFNFTFGPDEMTLIAKIFVRCNVKVLRLVACEPKADALKAFLDSSVGAKLDELYVSSYQSAFGPDEMMVIAKICKKRKVDRFCLVQCLFLPGALESFLLHSIGAKILMLGIGFIEVEGDKGTLLGRIIKQCGVETLNAQHPEDLNSIDVKAFKISSDNFKLEKLKCGPDDSELPCHVDRMGKFFTHVVKGVLLTELKIQPRDIQFLQRQLDERMTKGCKITLKKCKLIDLVNWTCDLAIENMVFEGRKSNRENVPSIVENRRAELNNDGSITVSCHYPDEELDVQYHVETFCNDQSTGDIEICRDPYYQCKTPRPSEVHCFKIWVVDSNGISGDAMFTNEVMSCPLVQNEQMAIFHEELSNAQVDSDTDISMTGEDDQSESSNSEDCYFDTVESDDRNAVSDGKAKSPGLGSPACTDISANNKGNAANRDIIVNKYNNTYVCNLCSWL